MLDELYKNIGVKIKAWAKWIFIVEAIAAIIGGLLLIFDGEGLIGFIILIAGPLVAWVSSWLLYAFGELVEKTVANESNTRNILKKLTEDPSSPFAKTASNTYTNISTNINTTTHKWRCDSCGNMKRTQTPCEFCGKE